MAQIHPEIIFLNIYFVEAQLFVFSFFASYIFIGNLNGKKALLWSIILILKLSSSFSKKSQRKGPQTFKTASGHL